MSVVILRGDARALPLPDASVDLLVTSPPYWSLRDYRDGGESLDGQIGSEATPSEYVDALLECTAEWARVLKPSGSMFVVLGDKHSTGSSGMSALADWSAQFASGGAHTQVPARQRSKPVAGFPRKSLLLLPHRYAIGCIDKLDLIVRAEIAWDKVNPLPDSTKDRVGRSHEMVFHLVKQPTYYSATDEIREPQVRSWTPGRNGGRGGWDRGDHLNAGMADAAPHPLGRIPGSVWQIPTAPLVVPPELGIAHYAAFPPELVRRIVLGWSPAGICDACGQGRRPVTDRRVWFDRARDQDHASDIARRVVNRATMTGGTARSTLNGQTARNITGYVCACTPYTDHPDRRRSTVTPSRSKGRGHQENDLRAGAVGSRHHGNDWPERLPVRDYHFDQWEPAPTRPALVVDQFAGTGTSGMVADVLGRDAVLVDRSRDYCRLAEWRVSDPGERARALGVPKPPKQVDGQASLFEEMTG